MQVDRSGHSLPDAPVEAMLLRLHSVIDVEGLWSAVQFILAEVVPCDACVLYLSALGFSTTGQIPIIFTTFKANKFRKWMRHRGDAEPLPPFMLASAGTKICQLSDVLFDPRQLRHAEFFRRYMAPENWHHLACAFFWDETRLTSGIAIMRTAKQGRFTDHEIAALNRFHPHLDATLQRLVALERRARAHTKRESFSLDIPLRSLSEWETATPADTLTPAESQLVRLLHVGLSNKEIATRLQKSVRTVKTQLTSVYRKYGVRSRTRLLATMMGHTRIHT